MNILGNDTLKGSVALSVWEILARNPGARLDEIDYPAAIAVHRRALSSNGLRSEDVEILGMKVDQGAARAPGPRRDGAACLGQESDLLFGRGRHVCLGKPMTLAIWRAILRTLSTMPLRFTIGEMKLRTGDYAFNYPEYARVRIHE